MHGSQVLMVSHDISWCHNISDACTTVVICSLGVTHLDMLNGCVETLVDGRTNKLHLQTDEVHFQHCHMHVVNSKHLCKLLYGSQVSGRYNARLTVMA